MISVIIPVYNCEKTIKEVLTAVINQIESGDEIIAVNDGSTDNTANILNLFKITVINQSKRGPAAARHAGAQSAKNGILLFIDGDVLLSPNILPELKKLFVSHPDIDGYCGGFSKNIRFDNLASRFKNLYLNFFLFDNLPDLAVKGLNSSILSIKKKAFFQVGGFNEKMANPIVEDMELGIRLSKKNFKIAHHSKLEVEHIKNLNISQLLTTDLLKSKISTEFMIFHLNDKKIKTRSNISVFHPLVNNLSYYFSIPLSFLFILLTAAFFLSGIEIFLISAIFLLLFILILNFKFIFYIKQNYGLLFSLKSIAVIITDQIAMGCGIIIGLFNLVLNRKNIVYLYDF